MTVNYNSFLVNNWVLFYVILMATCSLAGETGKNIDWRNLFLTIYWTVDNFRFCPCFSSKFLIFLFVNQNPGISRPGKISCCSLCYPGCVREHCYHCMQMWHFQVEYRSWWEKLLKLCIHNLIKTLFQLENHTNVAYLAHFVPTICFYEMMMTKTL